MFVHAKHAALGRFKSVKIVSYDTDVLVKGVAVFDEWNVDQLGSHLKIFADWCQSFDC